MFNIYKKLKKSKKFNVFLLYELFNANFFPGKSCKGNQSGVSLGWKMLTFFDFLIFLMTLKMMGDLVERLLIN